MSDSESYKLCKRIASIAVQRMEGEGYTFKSERCVFAYSDTLDLAEEIHIWLLDHMTKR